MNFKGAASKYARFIVDKITILLPSGFKPYPSQEAIMTTMMQCLNKKENALIESPTGTGKTLALLASSCAWLQDYRTKKSNFEERINENNNDEDENGSNNDFVRKRIYYATRTHQQCTQVIKEANKLSYFHSTDDGEGPFQHIVLASRNHFCLNEKVRKSKDPIDACKKATDTIGVARKKTTAKKTVKCKYFSLLSTYKCLDELRSKISAKIDYGTIFDSEKFVKACKSLEICPYYASRRLSTEADIIFTPYNYLIDPVIRNASNIDLTHSIVILDEAHNVEDVSRNAASFSFTESDIRAAFYWLDGSLENFRKELKGEDKEKVIPLLLRLKDTSNQLLCFLTDLVSNMPSNSEKYTWNLNQFSTILKEADLYDEDSYDQLNQLRDDYFRITRPSTNTKKNLSLSSVSISVIGKFLYFMQYFQKKRNQKFYKCNVSFGLPMKNQFSDDHNRFNVSSFRPDMEATLNFWCMSPSVAFMDAFKDCHSVILASGTLSPTESLKTELGREFHTEMVGEQIIPEKQIFARVITKGPSGRDLKFKYDTMQDPTLFNELLQAVEDICKIVPGGILVFVSNYSMIYQIQKLMDGKDCGIKKYKKVFYESSTKAVKQTFDDYSAAIKNSVDDSSINGAILFGVFRGKISEGIDFPDNLARCVINVGIPYPNIKDEQVILKIDFNDSVYFPRNKKGLLSGDQWYQIQAYRAINQAAGRGHRHRNDWCGIIFIDERFSAQFQLRCLKSKRLSKWIRDSLKKCNNHQTFLNDLHGFVNERLNDIQKLSPLTEEKQQIIPDIDDVNDPFESEASTHVHPSTASVEKILTTDDREDLPKEKILALKR